jgi:pyruvate dehydrogenase E1 component alpha subunit
MFGMGTSSARSAAMTEYHKRGQYIPGLKVNGMDTLAVIAAVKYAKEYMLAGRGPLVYEFNTYRFFGHSVSDPGLTYRTRDDVKKIRDVNDPISNLAVKLLERDLVDKDGLKDIENDAKAEVDKEVAQAEAMPEPEATPQILFEDIYVRGSEPAFARGRTPDENYYYHNTVGED